jgi:hypothetical protein
MAIAEIVAHFQVPPQAPDLQAVLAPVLQAVLALVVLLIFITASEEEIHQAAQAVPVSVQI